MSRLTMLTETEQQEYEYPPLLTTEARAVCFSIDNTLSHELKQLRGAINKVGFLLQYAYFKACKRFYIVSRFRLEDVEYAANLLELSKYDVNLSHYNERTYRNHQKKILGLFEYKSFSTQVDWVTKEILTRVERVLEPRTLFLDILHLLHENHIEIPTYNILAETITEYYLEYENKILSSIDKALTKEQAKVLTNLVQPSKTRKAFPITQYKTVNQSLKPKSIQASVNLLTLRTYSLISHIFELLKCYLICPNNQLIFDRKVI